MKRKDKTASLKSEKPYQWERKTLSAEEEYEYKLSSATKKLTLSLAPISLNAFVTSSIQTVLLIFLKKSNMDELTGALGLAIYWLQIVVYFLITDLNVGFKARASHAFGAKNYQEVGLYLHRSLIINFMMLLPSTIFIIFSDIIFVEFMGVEVELAQKARALLIKMIPSTFFFVVQDTLTAFLNSCHFFGFPAWVQIISNISFWLTSFIFIATLALGIDGIAICQFFLYFFSSLMLIVFIWKKNPYKETLSRPSSKSFENLFEHLKFNASLGSMSYFDDISGSIITLLSSGIDEFELSAYFIMRAVFGLMYCVPGSLQQVILPYISSSIGENKVSKGKKYLTAGIFCALSASVLSVGIVALFSEAIFDIYNSDEQLVHYAYKILKIYMIVMPFDFVQMVMGMALRALGMQKLGVSIIIFCNYVVGIPLALHLNSLGKGSIGLAMGEVAGCFAKFLCFYFVLSRLDWEKEAKKLENSSSIDVIEADGEEEESMIW